MSTRVTIVWTGEVGEREALALKLAPLGVEISTQVTPETHVICVGEEPKLGKINEAQMLKVPAVKPEYLHSWLKTGREPSLRDFVVDPFGQHSARRLPSYGGSITSPLSSPKANAKKRLVNQLSGYDRSLSAEALREVTSPSKRSKLLSRSFSSASVGSASSSQSSSATAAAKKASLHDSSHIRYASAEDPGAVIALEGLIGIGKSTLCNKLTQLYPDEVDVYREETNEKFLQLFYSDPKRYGFALQWGMLKSRIYQLRLAQHDTRHGRWPHRELLFWDRSMIGDYTFALWNHLLGGISKQEMEAYESEFGGSVRQLDRVAFVRDVALFVLMNDEPARCKTRVEVNRKNASEQGIPLDYYEGLDDVHFHMFVELMRSRICKVLIQSWGEYDDADTCKALYENAIEGNIPLPSIIDEPAGLNVSGLTSSDPTVLIYNNGEDINTQYNLLKSANTVAIEELKAYKDIYVPRDALRIDPAKKGIDMAHWEPYNIKFYENAFKRVVLFHMGQSQTIHFYDSAKKL